MSFDASRALCFQGLILLCCIAFHPSTTRSDYLFIRRREVRVLPGQSTRAYIISVESLSNTLKSVFVAAQTRKEMSTTMTEEQIHRYHIWSITNTNSTTSYRAGIPTATGSNNDDDDGKSPRRGANLEIA